MIRTSAINSPVRFPIPLTPALPLLMDHAEQEITGDVLLELDVNVLKTEIGILAFGKRMRIANAIAELRRPPSISSFEPHHEVHTPSSMIHQPVAHSRTQSVSQSHHSFPGTPLYGHAHSVNSSLGSPVGYHPPTNGQMPATTEGQTNGTSIAAAVATSAGVGLGIGVTDSSSRIAVCQVSLMARISKY